jgi:hypothetical protein
MAALLFSFSNHGKSFTGRFKDFHLEKVYRDVYQIIIKKVGSPPILVNDELL